MILVTGATGFIGSHLCRSISNFIGLGRLDTDNIIGCDITDIPKLKLVFKKNIKTVIHLAATSNWKSSDPFYYLKNNIEGTLNILNIACNSGVKKIIYASTQMVYNSGHAEYLPVDEKHPTNPTEFYGGSKLMGELYCRAFSEMYGVNVISLRLSGVYGCGKNNGVIPKFASIAKCGGKITIHGNGTQTADFTYIKDVIEAIKKCIDVKLPSKFNIFNIGSGREISVREIAETLNEIVGNKLKIEYIKGNSNHRFCYDITKAKENLRFKPTELRDALKDFLNCM